MSKQRAQRRAQRERDEAVRRAAEDAARQRAARRRGTRDAVAAKVVPQRTRWRGQQGLLARRRRTQNGVIACLVLASQLVVWLLTADPYARGIAAVLAVVLTPVLVTLALDRRS